MESLIRWLKWNCSKEDMKENMNTGFQPLKTEIVERWVNTSAINTTSHR